jgi:CRISPR/Cas system CSM-associated protein Csm4 (group 5 of RAMP superfamily)
MSKHLHSLLAPYEDSFKQPFYFKKYGSNEVCKSNKKKKKKTQYISKTEFDENLVNKLEACLNKDNQQQYIEPFSCCYHCQNKINRNSRMCKNCSYEIKTETNCPLM